MEIDKSTQPGPGDLPKKSQDVSSHPGRVHHQQKSDARLLGKNHGQEIRMRDHQEHHLRLEDSRLTTQTQLYIYIPSTLLALVASLLLAAMPGAPSSVLVPSSKARSP